MTNVQKQTTPQKEDYLQLIYNNLQRGVQYGRWTYNVTPRRFLPALFYKTDTRQLVMQRKQQSCVLPASPEALRQMIMQEFQMTPEEFLQRYSRR